MKPIVIVSSNWQIPPVTGPEPNGPCMETSSLTTDRMYVSCGEDATMRLWDDRAQRAYDMCGPCGDHNVLRGMRVVAGSVMQPRVAAQLARTSDPETSHEAAEAVVPKLRQLQERVLSVLTEYGPMTQHELIEFYMLRHGRMPESTIRTRCSELVAAGRVEDSGERALLPSGRRAVKWRVR